MILEWRENTLLLQANPRMLGERIYYSRLMPLIREKMLLFYSHNGMERENLLLKSHPIMERAYIVLLVPSHNVESVCIDPVSS